MKYRCLTYQEFALMEADFSEFLYEEKISYFEWKVLQDQHSQQAQHLLKKYSDLTFDKVMKDIECLQFRSNHKVSTIYFKSSAYVKIEIESLTQKYIDFNQPLEKVLTKRKSSIPLKVKKSVKNYEESRENKIFQLIESGFYVVPFSSFQQVDQLKNIQLN